MALYSATDGPATATGTQISTSVVQAVADVENTDPMNLSPLYEVVDPDALDGVFHGSSADGVVEFVYHGHHVTVTSDGTIDVEEDVSD